MAFMEIEQHEQAQQRRRTELINAIAIHEKECQYVRDLTAACATRVLTGSDKLEQATTKAKQLDTSIQV